MSNAYRGQHLVSKVLLVQFTAPSGPAAGRLHTLRRATPDRVQSVSPRRTAKEEWFIDAAPRRFEETWGLAENKMAASFTQLASHTGDAGISDETAESIRDVMALHLVRSRAAKALWSRGHNRVAAKRRAAIAGNSSLMALARSTGTYPAEWSPEEIVDAITVDLEDPLREGGEGFGETLVDLYRSVQSYFGRMHLEIGEAVDAEFLLPDLPCMTFDAKTGRAGLLGGVGLKVSDAIIMPLGPRHIASLRTNPTDEPWLRLDEDMVKPINEALARTAIDAVFYRPGSGLDGETRHAWSTRPAN